MGSREMVKKPVICLIGAGSRVFSYNMCTDMAQFPALNGSDIRLVDIDPIRLSKMADLFRLISDTKSLEWKITTHADRNRALPGADFVIISVALDRINRWEKDLDIAREHGIVETQGECGGPGGLSLTLRNIPLLLSIGRDVERWAPGALIINFSNPMTRVCLAINRYTKVKVVGLCHGLLTVERYLNSLLDYEVGVSGFGINHFNWIFAAHRKDNGENAWKQVVRRFQEDASPKYGYSRELYDVFGRIVAPDDIHITDFIHHWRGSKNGLNPRYELQPKSMQKYREGEKNWENRIDRYLDGSKNPWTDINGLSGEGAIPILSTYFGLSGSHDEISVNIPNDGYISNLHPDALVEVPARVSKNKITGCRMGDLPEGLKSLIQRQLEIGELAVEAAIEGSYTKALQALAIDPIITDLKVAEKYLADIIAAHRDLLTTFY